MLSVVSAEAKDNFHWVQYVPGGLEARAATEGTDCPKAAFDGTPAQMSTRSAPGEDFPVLVCSVAIPKDTKNATIDGVPLPLPHPRIDRILVIGDTGCRLKGKQVQACNDINSWPFRIGADIGAELKPDLVLHVGDFDYRESACPLDNKGCAGTPFGDTWEVWRSDFFSPGEALLDAAPWVFVRGNHEECDRGGKGWARTLDPYVWKQQEGVSGCLGPAQPFTVDLGGITLGVLDVSTADETKVNEQQAAGFRSAFKSVIDQAGSGPVWFAFHRPIWVTDGSAGNNQGGDNQTLAAAARDTFTPNVQLTINGHHHVFEAMSYVQDLPPTLVAGNGGDDLSPDVPPNPVGLTINGVTVKAGIARPKIYGYSMLERMQDGSGKWTFTGYDIHGEKIGACLIDGRNLDCK
jgi:hypothetical protein